MKSYTRSEKRLWRLNNSSSPKRIVRKKTAVKCVLLPAERVKLITPDGKHLGRIMNATKDVLSVIVERKKFVKGDEK